MDQISEINIGKIKVGEHAQRIDPEDPDTVELAASIGRVGIINPLSVVKAGDLFSLLSGHRRLVAARIAGKATVPCIVRSSGKAVDAEVTFAENFFRKDLSPIELSCAIKDIIDQEIMTVEELAAGFHRKPYWVGRMVAICDWPADVQEAIHEKAVSISAGSNLALVTDDTYRAFLVRNAIEQGATARTTAAWLQAWQAMQPAEVAITAEPVPAGTVPVPLVPQAPCLCCSQLFKVNEMSHVPVCGACIQLLRTVGMTQA